MVDFVRLNIKNPAVHNLTENLQLEWVSKVNKKTGVLEKKRIAEVNGIEFKSYTDNFLIVSLSLHKYWNFINGNGQQNYNDFTFSDLQKTIETLCALLDLSPDQCKIENIEYGVNVIPPFPTEEILNNLILHKRKPFNRERETDIDSLRCKHSQIIIKIYDKGLQAYKLKWIPYLDKIFRYENKATKMERLKGIGIFTLNDLLNKDKLLQLGELLQADFDDLVFSDNTIPQDQLTPSERLILANGRNPLYWEQLNKDNPNYFPKKLKRFRELVMKYGTRNYTDNLKQLISEKWNELLTSDSETVQVLTGVEIIGNTIFPNIAKGKDITVFDHLDKLSIPVQLPSGLEIGPGSALYKPDGDKGKGREWMREYIIPVIPVKKRMLTGAGLR